MQPRVALRDPGLWNTTRFGVGGAIYRGNGGMGGPGFYSRYSSGGFVCGCSYGWGGGF